MKKITLISLILVILCLGFTSGCERYDVMNVSGGDVVLSFSTEKIDFSQSSDDGKSLLKFYYDKVVVGGGDEVSSNINKIIEKDGDEFMSNKEIVEYYNGMVSDKREDCYCNTAQSEVTCNSDGIFSVKMTTSWYAGGVFNGGYYGLNFDAKTGNQLGLGDIFDLTDEEICNYINDLTIAKLTENTLLIDESVYETLEGYNISDYAFYIQSGNVYICYPTYELASGAAGPITVECPIIKKNETDFKLNGKKLEIDALMVADKVLVSVEEICNAIGAEVYNDGYGQSRIISILKDDYYIMIANGLYTPQTGVFTKWRIDKYYMPNDVSYCHYPDNLSDKNYNSSLSGLEIYNDTSIMETAPVVIGDISYVPVDILADYFGAKIDYNITKKQLDISMNNTEYIRTPEERKAISDFDAGDAAEIFESLPDISSDAIFGRDCSGVSYNRRGLVYRVLANDEAYVMIYPDYSVDYINNVTGELIKTINIDPVKITN